jgi:hypothetical protein
MKRRTLELLLLAAFSGSCAFAQIDCSKEPFASKIVCQFPIATGVLVNQSALGTSGSTSGANSAVIVATGINIGIATQVSQLPIASASAGTIVILKGGVPETISNLGPILVDRAQTIGKGRVFVGFTGSQFVFTNIDGLSLSSLPFGYVQTAYVPNTNNQVAVSNTYTQENTDLSFKINQFTVVGTVGLTNKIDLTAIVPIERVSLGAHTLNPQSYIVNANNTALLFGPYTPQVQSNAASASGLGDVLFNGKYQLFTGEHATFAAAASVRAPTGDDLNLLGAGAWGFNPYLAYSYLQRFSPHLKIGYQWNTSSELDNPNNAPHGNQNLPGGAQYNFGADWAAFKRLTLAADILGNQYLNTPKVETSNLALNNLQDERPGNSPPFSNVSLSLKSSAVSNTSYTINNFSGGFKWRPVGSLVLSGNLLVQLNNTGLRSRPTPLVGISYKF